MNNPIPAWFALLALSAAGLLLPAPVRGADCPAFLAQEFPRLRASKKVDLGESFTVRPLLIVNTASTGPADWL